MRTVILFICLSFSVSAASRVCEGAGLPQDLPVDGFKHRVNRLASKFRARHSLNDAIAVLGHPAHLEGKLNYGILARNLKNEDVEVWVDTCKGRMSLVARVESDRSGMIRYKFWTDILEQPGVYRVWMRVAGDGTFAYATLRVVANGTRTAVFDVDGTLTAHETDITLSILSEVLRGCFSPPLRDAGPELTRFLRDVAGYEIIYLSGRHHFMNDLTRRWLAEKNFAPGTLMVTQSLTEVFPRDKSVGRFKHAQLGKIQDSGLYVDRAYGNAQTDIVAYKRSGIAKNHIFAVGLFSGQLDAVSLGHDFRKHYEELISAGSGAPR